MSITATPKRIFQAELSGTIATIFTNDTNKEHIKALSICNTGGAKVSVRLAVVPNGETLSVRHYILYDMEVASKETKLFDTNIILESLDTIRALGAAGVSIQAYGAEWTTVV